MSNQNLDQEIKELKHMHFSYNSYAMYMQFRCHLDATFIQIICKLDQQIIFALNFFIIQNYIY